MERKTLFTAQPSGDRQIKNLLFLNLIKKQRSTSRTEISRLTDINIVTVSNYVNSYLKKGLLVERGYDVSSGGRKPELIELNSAWGYMAGISLGENTLRGVLVDLGMNILASNSLTNYEKSTLDVSVKELLEKLVAASNIDRTLIKKIGMGIVTDSEEVAKRPDLLKDAIENETEIPTIIGDAPLCAAFAEKNSNPEAKDALSILYIYSDRGHGVFIKGDSFYEANNKGYKYAYLRPWNRRLGIISEAWELIDKGVGTKIVDKAGPNFEDITVEAIIQAAREGDEIAIELIRMAGMNLGVRIAYLANLFEPQIIIIGGGIEKAGDLFLKPVALSIEKFVSQRILAKIKLTPSDLGEECCAKGGAFLAMREALIEA